MKLIFSRLNDIWQSRAPRERALLLAGALFLAVTGWVFGLILPAVQGSARLNASLPSLAARAVQVELLAKAAPTQLPAKPSVSKPSADTVSASLIAAGLTMEAARVTGAGADLQVQLTDAPAQPLWTWLLNAFSSSAALKRSASGAWSGSVKLPVAP